MTGPRFRPDPDELAPRVITQDQVRTGAGTPAVARIVITNQAPEPRIMAVTALGLDAEWLPRPIRTRPVLPGESVPVDLWFSPATGTVPARYPLAIAVQALEPVHGQATSPTTIADVLLVVDAPGQIAIELDPADTTAVFGKRFTVVLRNTGSTPASVRLDAQTPLSTNVRVPDDEVVVGPGQTVRLRGRVRVHRPQLLGHRSRHTYTVSARSSAAPRHAEGSLTARALFGPGGTKVVALLAVVGVWLALAVVFIPKLANNARNRTIAGQGVATAPASPGSSAGAGGAGASAGTGGATGSGAGSKSGPGGAGNSPSGASPAAVQLNGSVTGNSPAGVTVAMAPTSLVDEQVAGATPVGLSTESLQSVREIGKVPSSAVLLTQPGTVSASRSTVTGADGAWSFAQVRAPGYYLVTFSKPGYQTQRYVIDAANAVATQPLKVALVAGQGRLSGAVNGPSGPVGGAQITITDGTNTITTSSTSTGTIGQWSVDGLSTPSSYLITAGKGGLSTESQLITLDAGATASVTLRLQTGVVSLVGTVRGVDGLGALVGLGDAQVTVTDGTITRTASTITQGPVGNYTLPDLPPGQYTITIEFPGYQAQTQRVKLTAGESKVTVSAVLTSASSVVAGQVTGDVLDSNGNATGATVAKVGAGLTLASPTNTYKITSTSNGSFRFSGVTPGTYVLSAEYAGLRTGFATVKAVAGSSATASFDLKVQTVTNNATIAGFVGSATNPSGTIVCQTPAPTNCITFMLVDSAGHAVPISPADQPPSASGPTGYTLAALASTGLAPGLYHLTIGAVGYLPASVSVEVPLDGVARAPQVSLYPANTISGAVSALGNLATDGPQPPYTNCVWAIPDGVNAPAPTNCQPPTASTCTQTGRADVAFTTISATDNTYSLDGLCDGTYRVYIVVTNPFYVSPAPVATETVSHGQTANYSPHVFRKGRVVLTIFQLDQTTGALTPAADGSLTGTASCTGSPAADLSTMAGGKVVVAGVNAGTVACSAATTNPTRSGVVHAVAVGNDQDSASSLTLVAALGPATGRVVSTWGTG
ncbi:MAG TPA: carboxypeptidase-like regulatory domain-containing protein, partial [Jatrophihabitans sp.]